MAVKTEREKERECVLEPGLRVNDFGLVGSGRVTGQCDRLGV